MKVHHRLVFPGTGHKIVVIEDENEIRVDIDPAPSPALRVTIEAWLQDEGWFDFFSE